MTESERLLRQASVSVPVWVQNVRNGRYADWRKTKVGQALLQLEKEAKVKPTPPPVPPPPASAIRATGERCVFFSTVTDDACREFAACGPGYTALLSADRNEAWAQGRAYYATDTQIRTLHNGGGNVGSWCDSDQTPISFAVTLRARIASVLGEGARVAPVCGQFETVGQWHLGRDAGLKLMIGNPSELKDKPELAEAISAVDRGEVALIGEALQVDPLYSAQGINVSSVAFYVDRDANRGGYNALQNFSVMPPGLRRVASVYTGHKMTGDDWRLFREWTRP